MRVLVARDRDYIGAVLVPLLCAAGPQVGGLGFGLHEGGTPALRTSSRRPRYDWDTEAPMLWVTVTPPDGMLGS